MPVRHLGTYSPFAGFAGGNSGYTLDQRRDMRRSARIKSQRRLEDLAQKREELRSAERQTAAEQAGRVASSRVSAEGTLASAKARAAGGITQQKIAAAGGLAERRLMGAQERAKPLYRAEESQLAQQDYENRFMSLAAPFTTYQTTETGETVPTLPTAVRRIQQKYAVSNLTPEDKSAAIQAELGQFKSDLDAKRAAIDEHFGNPENKAPEEFYADLDLMEGTSDESISAIDKWYGEVLEAQSRRGAVESPAVKAGTSAGEKVREDLRLGNIAKSVISGPKKTDWDKWYGYTF